MKFLLRSFSYFIVFILAVLLFLPKIELFNLVEKELEKNSLIISNEKKVSQLNGLTLENADIYYQEVLSANIEKIDITTYLVYSKFEINNLIVSKSLQNFLPRNIEKVEVDYSILDFKKLNIKAKGKFGELFGYVDIFERKLKVELNPTQFMKLEYRNILREFRLKDGKYYYEQNI